MDISGSCIKNIQDIIKTPLALLDRYYKDHQKAYTIIRSHSEAVMYKAWHIAEHYKHRVDCRFIIEAAMLHDIGAFRTNAPGIGCYGVEPYLCHGIIGRSILENDGLPKHALVCERHIGVGLTRDDIIKNNLPLPQRDMAPITHEEKIICLADLFFNKTHPGHERTIKEVKNNVQKYGADKLAVFEKWLIEYGLSN